MKEKLNRAIIFADEGSQVLGSPFFHRDGQQGKILRAEALRVLRSHLTLPAGATVCCLPWARPGDGATASAGVFTMQRQGLRSQGASRVWIHLRGLLGLGLGGSAVGKVAT